MKRRNPLFSRLKARESRRSLHSLSGHPHASSSAIWRRRAHVRLLQSSVKIKKQHLNGVTFLILVEARGVELAEYVFQHVYCLFTCAIPSEEKPRHFLSRITEFHPISALSEPNVYFCLLRSTTILNKLPPIVFVILYSWTQNRIQRTFKYLLLYRV